MNPKRTADELGNFARSMPDSAVGERTLNLFVKPAQHYGRVKQSLRASARLTGRFLCDQNDR
jgi:hypothetical protein